VLAYRLLMLGWALWLAASIMRWVPWAWTAFSAGGCWRRAEVRAADVVPATADAAAAQTGTTPDAAA
jgi:hypothetical protein